MWNWEKIKEFTTEAINETAEDLKPQTENKSLANPQYHHADGDLENELIVARAKIIELSEQLEAKSQQTAELDSVRAQLQEADAARDSLLRELAGMHARMARMQMSEQATGASHDAPNQTAAPAIAPTSAATANPELEKEVARLKAEIERLTAEAARSVREAERLRTHLLEQEAAREAREDEIERERESWSTRLQAAATASQMAADASRERDQALADTQALAAELRAKDTALQNLQLVLEQIQAEHDAAVQAELALLRKRVATADARVLQLEAEVTQLQGERARAAALEQRAAEHALAAARASNAEEQASRQAAQLRTALDAALGKLSSKAQDAEQSVDKRLVKKLVVTCLDSSAPASTRADLLAVMARLLNFSDDDKRATGLLPRPRGWSLVPSFLRGPTPVKVGPSGSTPPSADAAGNITDLWVQFLLAETAAAAQQQQQQQQHATPAPAPQAASGAPGSPAPAVASVKPAAPATPSKTLFAGGAQPTDSPAAGSKGT